MQIFGGKRSRVVDENPGPERSASDEEEPEFRDAGDKYRRRTVGLQQLSLPLMLSAIIVVFGISHPDTFLTMVTLRSISAEQGITVIMALSLVAPLASGTIDASIGGTMGLSMIVVAYAQAVMSLNPIIAVVLATLVGLLIGAVNALAVVRFQVHSFIATIAMSSILAGTVRWVSGGQDIVSGYSVVGSKTSGFSAAFLTFGRWKFLTISAPFYYMLAISILLAYFLRHRRTGRYLYAIGSNSEAARLAGVRNNRYIALGLILSGLTASFAGILLMARLGIGSVQAGPNYLLPAFAAVFLGATQSRTGTVNVIGTVFGVYMLATGVHGLQLLGAEHWVGNLFNGAALIVAVAISKRVQTTRGIDPGFQVRV